jgi:hypothetical protein
VVDASVVDGALPLPVVAGDDESPVVPDDVDGVASVAGVAPLVGVAVVGC